MKETSLTELLQHKITFEDLAKVGIDQLEVTRRLELSTKTVYKDETGIVIRKDENTYFVLEEIKGIVEKLKGQNYGGDNHSSRCYTNRTYDGVVGWVSRYNSKAVP